LGTERGPLYAAGEVFVEALRQSGCAVVKVSGEVTGGYTISGREPRPCFPDERAIFGSIATMELSRRIG
jgi:hypothetical protein